EEVAFSGAERAVQVGGVRGAGADGGAHDGQGFVEGLPELVGDDVFGDAGFDLGEASGEFDFEVPGVDGFGDVEDVAQVHLVRAHCRVSFAVPRRPRRVGAGRQL